MRIAGTSSPRDGCMARRITLERRGFEFLRLFKPILWRTQKAPGLSLPRGWPL